MAASRSGSTEAGDGSLETRWLTSNDQIRVHLEAGHKVAIRIENDPEQQNTLEFRWRRPRQMKTHQCGPRWRWRRLLLCLRPSMDRVIAGYRLLTGKATMLPIGLRLWQSRQRYETANSRSTWSRSSAREKFLRQHCAGLAYWHVDAWGSHMFDPRVFPIRRLGKSHSCRAYAPHDLRLGKFNPNTETRNKWPPKAICTYPILKST